MNVGRPFELMPPGVKIALDAIVVQDDATYVSGSTIVMPHICSMR